VEGDRWGITDREIKDMLQGVDIVKYVNSLRLRWYGHVERTQDRRMLKQIASDIVVEGKEEDHVKDGETRLKNI
jgi:hypothetical protein